MKYRVTTLGLLSLTLVACGGSDDSEGSQKESDAGGDAAGTGGEASGEQSASGGSASGGSASGGESSTGGSASGGSGGSNNSLGGQGGETNGTGGDACQDVSCDASPADVCEDSMTLNSFARAGTCTAGECSYEVTKSNCDAGCEAGACRQGCLAHEPTCNGAQVEVCDEGGDFQTFSMTCEDSCSSGVCEGSANCTPGGKRCLGDKAQVCERVDSSWIWVGDTDCALSCNGRYGSCEFDDLTVRSDIELDDTLIVRGTLTIEAGVTVTVPGGDLSIFADKIIVESGASIIVTPLWSRNWDFCKTSQGYATDSDGGTLADHQLLSNTVAAPGGAGCRGSFFSGGVVTCSGGGAGKGGGVLRLIGATSVVVHGTLSVNGADGKKPFNTTCSAGGGGGGAGGTLLLWSPSVDTSGSTLKSSGGRGASARGENGRNGVSGLIKIYNGTPLPVWDLGSVSHPDLNILSTYNDGASAYRFHWNGAEGAKAYLIEAVGSPAALPTGPQALSLVENFVALEPAQVLSAADLNASSSTVYLSVAGVDSNDQLIPKNAIHGMVLNHMPPTVTSSTHNDTTWTDSTTATFDLRMLGRDGPVTQIEEWRYVVTESGDSAPSEGNPTVPSQVKVNSSSPSDRYGDLSLVNLAPGAHMIHAVSLDAFAYPTIKVGRMLFLVGPNPGVGTISGKVTDSMGSGVQGVTVTLNNGLLRTLVADVTTGLDGSYTIENAPAGQWTVSSIDDSLTRGEAMVTLAADGVETADLQVEALP